MAAMNLEKRVKALEGEVARLNSISAPLRKRNYHGGNASTARSRTTRPMTRRCGSDASTASRSDPAGRNQRRRSAAARAAMVILDTDHVSFLHHGGAGPGLRLLQRLRALDPSEIATSIVR